MRARRYREMCLVLHRVVVVVVVGGDRGIVGVDNCFMATGLLGCGWDRGFVLWLHGNALAPAKLESRGPFDDPLGDAAPTI